MYGEVPAITIGRSTIRIFQLAGFALLLFGVNFHFLWLGLVPLLAVNLFVHYRLKNQIGMFASVFSRLKTIYRTINKVVPTSHFAGHRKSEIIRQNERLKGILKKVNILSLDQLQDRGATTPLWYLAELVKSITLLDVAIYHGLLRNIDEIRSLVRVLYYSIGEIEIALSVLALRRNTPVNCIPEFSDIHPYRAKGMYHPLVENAVPNDITIQKSGILVTGSNMSGKSTFIKMLSLNTLCAQSINTCFAETYSSPFQKIATSMNVSDDIETGASYYLKEVDRIGLLMEHAQTQDIPYLLTIDEVFRGTNTIERIGAAKSVLTYMVQKNALVVVSTHDIELADLLQDTFELYYFQEEVGAKDLTFDYKLREGVMTQRNAIKILGLAGYPKEVVEDAEITAKALAARL